MSIVKWVLHKDSFLEATPTDDHFKRSKRDKITNSRREIMKTKLLVKKIEGIDKFVFQTQYKQIRELIRQKAKNMHGVYALYDKKRRLYYVGQTKKDVIKRVKQHLNNKHRGKWQYFSIFLTKKEQQAREVESIILSVLPELKGNKQNRSKIGEDKKLTKAIERLKKEIDKRPILAAIGPKRRPLKKLSKKQNAKKQSKAGNKKFSLKDLFSEDKLLHGEHKQNNYSALLLTSGKVLYNGKEYSLSGAGKEITGLETNGWTFWQIQDHKNRWITLSALREKKSAFKKVA